MIESAFVDACKTYHGEPTPEALDSIEWLEARTEWTRIPDAPIPPPELREAFAGSFEWCCAWLGFNAAEVRQHGLPRMTVRARPPKKSSAQKTRPIRTGHKQSPKYVAGLPEVYKVWRRARKEWQSSHPIHLVQLSLLNSLTAVVT
jgi:hypothetical protein